MATNPIDPVEEEAQRVFADAGVHASLEEFHRQLRMGELQTHSTQDVLERLGLDPDELAGE